LSRIKWEYTTLILFTPPYWADKQHMLAASEKNETATLKPDYKN
jgi:hypothetical protein